MSTKPARVLLVEDDDLLRIEIEEALTDSGVSVKSLGDAGSALAALAEDSDITVLVADLRIPGGDGMCLAERVLGMRTPDTATEVIILTGYATLDNAVEAIRNNIFDFLRKPIRLTELEVAIGRAHEAALGRRNAAKATTAEIACLREQARTLLEQLESLESNPELGSARADDGLTMLMADGLRNPLVPISGLAEIIEDEGSTLSNATLTGYARHIRAAGSRLALLIESITALGQPGASEIPPRISKTGSGSVLKDLKSQPWFDSQGELYRPEIDDAENVYLSVDRKILSLILRLCLSQLLQTYSYPNAPISLRTVVAAQQVTFRLESASQCVATSTGTPNMTVADADYANAVRRHATLGLGFRLAMRLARTISGTLEVNSSQTEGTSVFLSVPRFVATRETGSSID